jgi:PAS domain S-box-containing protein
LHISYREKFAAAWSAQEKRLLPSYVWTSDPLTFWRERILFLICFIAAMFGPFALVPSLLLAYSEGLWIVIIVDSLAYMAAVTILIARNMSFIVRALFICFILYALGVCILFILGPVGAGYIWLFGASVLISTFIGLGAAIWTLVFNTIVMLSVGIFIAYGNPAWILHMDNALEKWLVMSTNFLLLNAFIAITTAFMLNGLKTAIIMEQKTSKSLRESEASYRQLFDNAPALIYRVDFKSGKFLKANDVFCEYLGCSQEEINSLNPYEILTEESKKLFLERLEKISQGVKVPEIVEYEVLDKKGKRWCLQLHNKNIYDTEGNVVASDVVAHDITERKLVEAELQQTLESLRKAFGATIQVMVSAVEMRDPYTSGHQVRVADLARAIAMEMGLPQDKIDGIRLAGSIHDIGKLSVPAEILSKPTKLTNLEFSMIKEHPQTGYDMLKDVESPWPLAQIVYQHHERMDGSGYPRNLKGDEILMEARILAVADVVEAMASHRPYRPALGIEAALEEIEKNRGTFYDRTVADACLRLFREKGFQLEGNKY